MCLQPPLAGWIAPHQQVAVRAKTVGLVGERSRDALGVGSSTDQHLGVWAGHFKLYVARHATHGGGFNL